MLKNECFIIKEMSFLKISDPLKRDAIVKEYLELKKKIRSNFLSERIGEQQLQTDLSKLYKPITETQKATTREIREGIEKLPEAIQPLIKTKEEGEEEEEEEEEEEKHFSEKVLKQISDRFKGDVDKIFGIKRIDNNYYLGNKMLHVDDNNIITIENNEKRFTGTPGLWELIISEFPMNYTNEDYNNYKHLMTITNATYRNNNPKQSHPKPANNDKWKYVVGPIWYMNNGYNENDAFKMAKDPKYKKKIIDRESRKRRKEKRIGAYSSSVGATSTIDEAYKGEGVVVIPSDPNALLERLDLLLASQEAGHTGVRNEMVSICDELKRQGVLDTKAYKKLNSNIKK